MTEMKGKNSADADIHPLHKEWDEISCPICMDHPHNAVLIICSSHEKGCRSYICDTSYRHSNCLDRFRGMKFDTTESSSGHSFSNIENSDTEILHLRPQHSGSSGGFSQAPRRRRTRVEFHEDYSSEENNDALAASLFESLEENSNQESVNPLEAQGEARIDPGESNEGKKLGLSCLKCPLCRGSVLGWMIVKEARQYLDLKSRSCSRESCLFSGNYRELRRHARRVHPTTRPADVDPSRQRAWHCLEHQCEYGDILSAIRSEMPGAIVLGDYVIDSGDVLSREHGSSGSGEDGGPWWTTLFLFRMISNPIGSHDEPRGSSRAWRTHRRRHLWGENLLGLQDDDVRENFNYDDNLLPRRRRRLMRSRPDEEQP